MTELQKMQAALDAQRAVLTWLMTQALSNFNPPPKEVVRVVQESVLKIALRMPSPYTPGTGPEREAYQTTVTDLAGGLIGDLLPMLIEAAKARGRPI